MKKILLALSALLLVAACSFGETFSTGLDKTGVSVGGSTSIKAK